MTRDLGPTNVPRDAPADLPADLPADISGDMSTDEFDRDPWAVGPLLAGHPDLDPGPMPETVEERIWDAIEGRTAPSGHLDVVDIFDVGSRMESDLGLVDELGFGTTEFESSDDDEAILNDSPAARDRGPRVGSFGRSRRGAGIDPAVLRRRRALAALGAAAAVVLLVVGGSALVRSVLGTNSGPASKAVSTLPMTTATAPLTSRLHVESSARAYTRANVATLAQDVLETPGTAYPFAPDSPDALPVTTASGLNGCLFTLGELDADRIAVDLATYEGAPAAIVVVIDGGLKQVYAVDRTCTKGNPHTLAGPFPMT